MARVVLVFLAVVVVLLGALWVFQRRLIYLPSPGAVPPAASVLTGATDVTLETSDGVPLGAWLVRPAAPDRRAAVLVANGNGGDRAGRAPLAQALAARGLTVLLFDYRGYGGNAGSPTERGLARDARAARRVLVEQAGFTSDRLVYFGESLGAAVVTELATEHPPAGLLLRSPFTDLASAGSEHYPFLPVRALLKDRFPLADQLATIGVPTTVVYGTGDSIIPPRQSRAVAEAATGPVSVVEVAGADHNDVVLLNGDALIRATVELVDRYVPR
jgi:alpha-beta hydrolase superfamily lysophospholipase